MHISDLDKSSDFLAILKKCSFSRDCMRCDFFTFAGIEKVSHIENKVTKKQRN